MKKINLREVSDILSDRQLKAVIGGYGIYSSCSWSFSSSIPCAVHWSGTCSNYSSCEEFFESYCVKSALIKICFVG